MPAHTKLPPLRPVNHETQTASPSPASAKEAETAGPTVYWGDRLTVKIWLFCFGLMVAIQLVDALHHLILSLLGRAAAP